MKIIRLFNYLRGLGAKNNHIKVDKTMGKDKLIETYIQATFLHLPLTKTHKNIAYILITKFNNYNSITSNFN